MKFTTRRVSHYNYVNEPTRQRVSHILLRLMR